MLLPEMYYKKLIFNIKIRNQGQNAGKTKRKLSMKEERNMLMAQNCMVHCGFMPLNCAAFMFYGDAQIYKGIFNFSPFIFAENYRSQMDAEQYC